MSDRQPADVNCVILAAGAGSRLRDLFPEKPLARVRGRSLLLRVLDSMRAAGATAATVVVGYHAEKVIAEAANAPVPVTIRHNPDWETTPNGVSLLAAASDIRPGTLLAMCDHLLAPELLQRLRAGARADVALGVDRRIGHPWVDESDVTRVRTEDDNGICRIVDIGKNLPRYDAYDTGAFVIGPALVRALRGLPNPSLSAGMAALGTAQAVDIGDASWLDVDDARAFAIAERDWAY